jgi:sigma-B regulation protein RsbU (phosphoserine phosphatase)
VGLFEDFSVTEHDVVMRPGDVLALYTDGVVEARGPGNSLFGDERLAAVLAASGMASQGIADEVLRSVLAFAGETTDDVALLVMKVPEA